MGIDFGPGQNHIQLRKDSKCYYVPELFHVSPLYNHTIPLLIHDLMTSVDLLDIYGSEILPFLHQGLIMINNHPLTSFKLKGRILDVKYTENNYNQKSFVLVTLDDSSGINLIVQVNIPHALYIGAGLSLDDSYGKYVEVAGVFQRTRFVEVKAFYVGCIGTVDDFYVQIDHWRDCLEIRDSVLCEPWKYEPGLGSVSHVGIDLPIRQVAEVEEYKDSDDSNTQVQNNIEYELESNDVVTSETNSQCSMENIHDIFFEEVEDNYDENVIKVVNEFQVILGIIHFLVEKGSDRVRLVDIYKYPKVSVILDNLTRFDLLNHGGDFLTLKHESFHKIRHYLQIDCNLIKVDKRQRVSLNPLMKLVKHLKNCLRIIKASHDVQKVLNVDIYLRTYRAHLNSLGEGINYKLINGIIELLIQSERENWKYDFKLREWSYIYWQL